MQNIENTGRSAPAFNINDNDAIIENRPFDLMNHFPEVPKNMTNVSASVLPQSSPGPLVGVTNISPFFHANHANPLVNNQLQ